jgi:uncharacterized protein (TIGR02145 family)
VLLKRERSIWVFLSAVALILLKLAGCSHFTESPGSTQSQYTNLPSVDTYGATSNILSADLKGGIIWGGNAPITTEGFCWSSLHVPTIQDSIVSKVVFSSGVGFTATLEGLRAYRKYYFNAFATNKFGTAYGVVKSFIAFSEVPFVTTSFILDFTNNTAIVGGNILFEGKSNVSEHGVYWDTSQNPEITGTKYPIDNGSVSFSSLLTGLNPKTIYYVKAYATNSIGTGFGLQLSFTTCQDTSLQRVTDIDGNVYHIVTIGTQIWMAENLKTTKFRDGTSIPNVQDDVKWSSSFTGAYCWYKNDLINKNIYGALYNFYAAIDNHHLCPLGWHVPTDTEWHTLALTLDANAKELPDYSISDPESEIAGAKMKEASLLYWTSNNTGVTNETGFTAFPGGNRGNGGAFGGLGEMGIWLSSSETTDSFVWWRNLDNNDSGLWRYHSPKNYGYSVRCVKDN